MISDTYEEIIFNAYKNNLFDENLYNKFKGLGSFRNILVHQYLEINDEMVYENFKKILSLKEDIIKFLTIVIYS